MIATRTRTRPRPGRPLTEAETDLQNAADAIRNCFLLVRSRRPYSRHYAAPILELARSYLQSAAEQLSH